MLLDEYLFIYFVLNRVMASNIKIQTKFIMIIQTKFIMKMQTKFIVKMKIFQTPTMIQVKITLFLLH